MLNGSADGRIALGALFEMLLVITNVGTAVVLFPIARRYSETLALTWVASPRADDRQFRTGDATRTTGATSG